MSGGYLSGGYLSGGICPRIKNYCWRDLSRNKERLDLTGVICAK